MYLNKIILYITILLLVLSSLFGFLFNEGVFGKTESIYRLFLDLILIVIGVSSIQINKRTKPLLIVFLVFIVLSFFSFLINNKELKFSEYINGIREFLPYFLFPFIYLRIFQSRRRIVFIKNFNRFLYFFLSLQIPVSLYQFLRYGAGDNVGGTLGNGGSGILTFTIFLTTYYLMTQGLNPKNVFKSLLKKSYLLIFWLPIFINETKISFLLIILFFIFLNLFSLYNLRKYIITGIVIIPLLMAFDSIYENTTNNSFTKEILDKDFIENYLSSNEDHYTDIPRFQKIAIFVTTFDTDYVLLGKGIGHFKGGTTMNLTSFASTYQWLLLGSRPMSFFLLVQVGILGIILFLTYWILIINSRDRKYTLSYSRNIIIFTTICLLLILMYNDSLRSLFFSGIIMYILIYATTGRRITNRATKNEGCKTRS